MRNVSSNDFTLLSQDRALTRDSAVVRQVEPRAEEKKQTGPVLYLGLPDLASFPVQPPFAPAMQFMLERVAFLLWGRQQAA